MEWDDLRTVLALVRHGSLARAGAALGLNYTTVARRIARAETAFGAALFDRLPEGYVPNASARLVADHAARMEAEDIALSRRLLGQRQEMTGRLIVTASQLVIAHVLCPVLDAFTTAHPQVDLTIRATNDLLDLERREADLAIRISHRPGDGLTGLRLCAQNTASFAAPDWAARLRDDPDGPVDWIAYSGHAGLPAAVARNAPGARIRYRFDDMIAIAGAVQAGLGVARMPMFLGRALPGIEQVPILPPQPYADIWVVGHADAWPGRPLRAFRDLLVPYMKTNAARFIA